MEEPIEVLLRAGFTKDTQIPKTILDLMPSPTIAVSSLLEQDLPTLLPSSAANLKSATSCMSSQPPRWTTEELFEAPIPPRTWLFDLEIS